MFVLQIVGLSNTTGMFKYCVCIADRGTVKHYRRDQVLCLCCRVCFVKHQYCGQVLRFCYRVKYCVYVTGDWCDQVLCFSFRQTGVIKYCVCVTSSIVFMLQGTGVINYCVCVT